MDRKLMRSSLKIAKNLAPKDTGNLALNAIKLRKVKRDGFTIAYLPEEAYYMSFVEEGTKYQKPQRFVLKTYIALSNFIHDYYEGKESYYNRYAKRVSGISKGSIPKRELVNLKSKYMHLIENEIEESK